MKITDFHASEERCFPCDDMWLGPCMILAAMVADEKLSESWEHDDFDWIEDHEEACLAIENSWRCWQAACVRHSYVVAYETQIEYTQALKGN